MKKLSINVRPMLATNVNLDKLIYPVYVSPKLDGIRAYVKDNVVYSRSGKPIPNLFIQFLFCKLHGADGELIIGNRTSPNVFQTTTSGVMTVEGRPEVAYYIFDYWDDIQNGIIKRLENLKKYNNPCISVIHPYLINNKQELYKYENNILNQGYEGVILRYPNALYKYGRSTLKEGGLLKLKRFKDSEAKIFGYNPLFHNNNPEELNELGYTVRSTSKNGMVELKALGSLEVFDMKTGISFNIGSGFTANQRKELWKERNKLLGKIVKYKYFNVTTLNVPRFPIFLGFRDKKDI